MKIKCRTGLEKNLTSLAHTIGASASTRSAAFLISSECARVWNRLYVLQMGSLTTRSVKLLTEAFPVSDNSYYASVYECAKVF